MEKIDKCFIEGAQLNVEMTAEVAKIVKAVKKAYTTAMRDYFRSSSAQQNAVADYIIGEFLFDPDSKMLAKNNRAEFLVAIERKIKEIEKAE